MTYHRRRPKTSPFSAANTPIWQVNDERISTVVTGTAIAMFSSVGGGGQLPCAWARATKYIANRPAKNISSLESQMMVPTLTMLGRFSECTRAVMADPGVPIAVVTSRSMTRRSTEGVVGCETRCAVSAAVLLRPRIPAGRGPCEARRMAAKNFAETRLGRLLRRRRGPAPLDPGRGDLVVVVSSYDDAEASSTVLARGLEGDPAWRPDDQAVLRHHLVLPAGAVEEVLAIVAQDGYAPDGPPTPTCRGHRRTRRAAGAGARCAALLAGAFADGRPGGAPRRHRPRLGRSAARRR